MLYLHPKFYLHCVHSLILQRKNQFPILSESGNRMSDHGTSLTIADIATWLSQGMQKIHFSPSFGTMANAAFPVSFDEGSYDLQKFMRDHPGGVNTLRQYRGRSIKNAMVKFGHSASAFHMLRDLSVDVNLSGKVSENGRIIINDEDKVDASEIAFLEELEGRLDWSKPILSQLEAVAPHYARWVNTAVYRDCRLFAHPLLEALTYTAWYLVPVFWIPIISYLAVTQYYDRVLCADACSEPALSPWGYLLHLASGTLIWSALEYTLHRWVFHLDPGSSLPLIKFHFVLHGMHHKVPFDGYRQVFPPIPAFVLTCIIYSLLRLLMSEPLIKLAGGLAGYLAYDMIHYYVHHGNPKDGSYLYAMKRYHSNHHFINHDKAFGISSKLWDYIFMTFVNVKKLNFSLNWDF